MSHGDATVESTPAHVSTRYTHGCTQGNVSVLIIVARVLPINDNNCQSDFLVGVDLQLQSPSVAIML